jgi:hypothetical protein
VKNQKTPRIIIPHGAYPEPHEIATAQVLLRSNAGDVEFLIPTRTKGAHTPDIAWNGIDWEIKAPIGNGKRTLDDTIRVAQKQSPNIILDLRRTKLDDEKTINKLRNDKNVLRGVKRLKVITKGEKNVDIR